MNLRRVQSSSTHQSSNTLAASGLGDSTLGNERKVVSKRCLLGVEAGLEAGLEAGFLGVTFGEFMDGILDEVWIVRQSGKL